MALILANADFLTMDADMPHPECLLVEGDSIRHAGDIAVAEALAVRSGMPFQRIDLGGRTVVPGLIDMHAHLDREGLKLGLPSMEGLTSRKAVLERIETLAQEAAPGEWIDTMPIGAPPFYFFADPDEELALYPTRSELDEVAPDNPVRIRPLIGFWRWSPLPERLISAANSLALDRAGISRSTAPPSPSVEFERQNGELTGRIVERAPISIVEFTHFSAARSFSLTERMCGIALSQRKALEAGITTVFEGHGLDRDVLGAYRGLHDEGCLHLRMECVASPRWHGLGTDLCDPFADWPSELAGSGIGDDMLRVRGLFVNPVLRQDDVLRSCACCHTGMVGYNFATGLPKEKLRAVMERAAAENMRLVGLNTELFDSLADLDPGHLQPGHGWLVQHRSHFPEDHQRIARDLGLGLSFLPVEAIYKQAALAAEGERKPEDWMPLARILAAGIPVSIATDNIPVSLFFGIWCCLARSDYLGRTIHTAEGEVSRLQALEIATLGAARCLGRDDRLGSLTAGKFADLAVLDRDYLRCNLNEIRDIRAVATMVGGAWRHDMLGLSTLQHGTSLAFPEGNCRG